MSRFSLPLRKPERCQAKIHWYCFKVKCRWVISPKTQQIICKVFAFALEQIEQFYWFDLESAYSTQLKNYFPCFNKVILTQNIVGSKIDFTIFPMKQSDIARFCYTAIPPIIRRMDMIVVVINFTPKFRSTGVCGYCLHLLPIGRHLIQYIVEMKMVTKTMPKHN